MYDPRLDKLADVLVAYSLKVRKGEVVTIKGPTLAEPLIVALTQRVLRAGGFPVIRCYPGAIEELICKLGAGRQLDFLDPGEKLMAETTDCYVGIWADENTRAMSGVDPRNQQARSRARRPVLETIMKRASSRTRKLRWVGTQYPCQASAQDADMSLRDYADFVYRAGLLHLPNPAAGWNKLHAAQQRACDFLNKAREIRFLAPNGTDLRLGIAGRRWINCNGENNFPDGEVFTGPLEDATQGTVAYSFPAVYGGREVLDVVLKFRDGRVVEARASKGEEFLLSMMDQDKGGRTLGEIAIGTNYGIRQYTRNGLFDEKIGGTFHAALGAAYPETGATNKSGLHWDMVCDLRRGGRIEVDGKIIYRNGRFLKPTWPQPPRGSRA